MKKTNLSSEGKIDAYRSNTHVIYDIASMEMENTSLTRNCHFKYSQAKNGAKKYDMKEGELKIERYYDSEEGIG